MYHSTIDTIIRDSISEALALPRDPISVELRDLALGVVNDKAQIIWLSWKWDDEKIDEFTTPTRDADGVITFGANVESVMAVKKVNTDGEGTTYVWPQDSYIAAVQGLTIGSDRFDHLAADSSGNKRILVTIEDDPASEYRCLALSKYARTIVDPAYDALNPSNTPLDYRVMHFPIYRAEPALRSAVKDALRAVQGIPREKDFKNLLNLALKRELYDNAKDLRSNPKSPAWSEVGNWEG